MGTMQWWQAILLGLVEGATEFLPVSSTGHLLLLQHFFGLDGEANKTFAVLVQLGAILGALAHSFIKGVLFNPMVVCISLIVGGLVLIVVDRLPLPVRYRDATAFPLPMYAGIGFIQCLAMVPGVSRSGATIVGAMALGADKRSAAEFSFFLAMPTMAGAFAYDLLKSYKLLTFDDATMIGLGFLAAFASGLLVVKTALDYISRHGFAPFAWWRIVIGSAGLAGLLVFG
jgi:undecaprenyl-diphosphatase